MSLAAVGMGSIPIKTGYTQLKAFNNFHKFISNMFDAP